MAESMKTLCAQNRLTGRAPLMYIEDKVSELDVFDIAGFETFTCMRFLTVPQALYCKLSVTLYK